jgi:hypothetical protein
VLRRKRGADAAVDNPCDGNGGDNDGDGGQRSPEQGFGAIDGLQRPKAVDRNQVQQRRDVPDAGYSTAQVGRTAVGAGQIRVSRGDLPPAAYPLPDGPPNTDDQRHHQ